MAIAFINAAHYNNASSTSAVVSKPTNTADNDIMFAVITRNNTTAPTPPSGWALLGSQSEVSGVMDVWLYWKLAASEGASYTWSFGASAGRTGGTIVTYRGGFDTADPIDVVSNTVYTTSNTTVRAASMSASAAGSALLIFPIFYASATRTYTKPSVPTTDWVEDVDAGSNQSRTWREVCSMTWASSGATGNMDATASASDVVKHAFAVVLNPTGGGTTHTKTPTDIVGFVDSSRRKMIYVRTPGSLQGAE